MDVHSSLTEVGLNKRIANAERLSALCQVPLQAKQVSELPNACTLCDEAFKTPQAFG